MGWASLVVQMVKNSPASAGDPGSIPGSGRSPGGGHGEPLQYSWAPLVPQILNNPPAMLETWVQSLGWEDLLEEGMATHSSLLAWRIPWTEEPGGLQSIGLQKSWTRLSDKYTQRWDAGGNSYQAISRGSRVISAVEGRSGWSPGRDRGRWAGGQPPGAESVGLGHWLGDAGGNRVNGCVRSCHSTERETFRVLS